MSKKSFNNPQEISERKGLSLLISETQLEEKQQEKKNSFTTSNVRIREDNREKIYTLKGRTGKSITEIYNMIFEYYFNNNPL